MSSWELEQQRQEALKLIVAGKTDFMQGGTLDIKKKGYDNMKEGVIKLTEYAKQETHQPYKDQATQKIQEYFQDLKEQKQFLDTYERNLKK